MCLFSFEPGNCVLPRANGTWASKDLSSVWNVEPTNSPQVCNLQNTCPHFPSDQISLGSFFYFFFLRKQRRGKFYSQKQRSITNIWVSQNLPITSKHKIVLPFNYICTIFLYCNRFVTFYFLNRSTESTAQELSASCFSITFSWVSYSHENKTWKQNWSIN